MCGHDHNGENDAKRGDRFVVRQKTSNKSRKKKMKRRFKLLRCALSTDQTSDAYMIVHCKQTSVEYNEKTIRNGKSEKRVWSLGNDAETGSAC